VKPVIIASSQNILIPSLVKPPRPRDLVPLHDARHQHLINARARASRQAIGEYGSDGEFNAKPRVLVSVGDGHQRRVDVSDTSAPSAPVSPTGAILAAASDIYM